MSSWPGKTFESEPDQSEVNVLTALQLARQKLRTLSSPGRKFQEKVISLAVHYNITIANPSRKGCRGRKTESVQNRNNRGKKSSHLFPVGGTSLVKT